MYPFDIVGTLYGIYMLICGWGLAWIVYEFIDIRIFDWMCAID